MVYKTIRQQINYLAGSRAAANYMNWLYDTNAYSIRDKDIIFNDVEAGVEITMTEYSIVAKYKDRRTKTTTFEKLSAGGAKLLCLAPENRTYYQKMEVFRK